MEGEQQNKEIRGSHEECQGIRPHDGRCKYSFINRDRQGKHCTNLEGYWGLVKRGIIRKLRGHVLVNDGHPCFPRRTWCLLLIPLPCLY
jgi:hypothetical protein